MSKYQEHLPVRLYRELEPHEQLIIFADPADTNDYCAAVAFSKKYYDYPLVMNVLMESSQFGYDLYAMAKYIYNCTEIWPKLAVERNTGQATIYVLKQLNYPDLFRMVDFTSLNSAEKGEIGWVTSGALSGGELVGTRRKMLDDLSLAINQGMLKIYDEEQLRQMKSFMIVKGRAQARAHKKDDLVMACYSDDTEVLTGAGWKLISEVKKGEIIPSLNIKTNQVENTVNKETINSPYRGDMIHFKGRSADFLVTPNHKMVVHKSLGENRYSELKVDRADNLIGKHFTLRKDAEWMGIKKGKWVIPEYKASKFHKVDPQIVLDTNDFFCLLGFYISEGSAYGNNKDGWKLIFSQKEKSKGYEPFKKLLDRLKIKYSYTGSDFVIHKTQLAKYFKGLVPGLSFEKRIPKEILTYDKSHLAYLYAYMMLGYGCNDRQYITSSIGLRDDFLELVNKLGWSATWLSKNNIGRKIFNNTRTVRHEEHYISIIKKQLRPRINHHRKDQVSRVYYEGNQVCLSLEKNHIMLVRRNGTIMWSGNTAGGWQVAQLTPEYDFGGDDGVDRQKEREKWRLK